MENGMENQIAMRKIGFKMNILMGISLSFSLSLIGLLSSGHFQIMAWLVSFALSTLLSFFIGFCLPVRKVSMFFCKKCGLQEHSLPALALESLISDIFYTPLITFLMVFLAYTGAKKQIEAAIANGAPAEIMNQLNFLPMFLHSLLISMIVGYILIFILQPLYLKILIGKRPNS